MRRLDRTSVPPPAYLARFRPGLGRWEDPTKVTGEVREEIRVQLGQLQKGHCAYCESDLGSESRKPHIEHFEQRSKALRKTFDWSNLFWSCSHEERCGKHKDRVSSSYDPRTILKPDVDDPRRYLQFTRDGEVFPRAGLDRAARQRAEETIRVFALNDQHLVAARRAYLRGPHNILRTIEAAGFTDHECDELLRDEARQYDASAFSAVPRS